MDVLKHVPGTQSEPRSYPDQSLCDAVVLLKDFPEKERKEYAAIICEGDKVLVVAKIPYLFFSMDFNEDTLRGIATSLGVKFKRLQRSDKTIQHLMKKFGFTDEHKVKLIRRRS